MVQADDRYLKLESLEPVVDAARTRIDQELTESNLPDWAGIYTSGDGFSSESLAIAPRSGFAYSLYGCLGLYSCNHGTVQEVNGRLQLKCAFTDSDFIYRKEKLEAPWIPMKWGTSKLLIPHNEVPQLCNDFNSGKLRYSRMNYFTQHSDDPLDFSTKPQVPQEFQSWLLDQPLECEITKVGSPFIETESFLMYGTDPTTRQSRVLPVTLNKGAKDGVFVGMTLFRHREAIDLVELTVTSVEENACHAVYREHIHIPVPADDQKPAPNHAFFNYILGIKPSKPAKPVEPMEFSVGEKFSTKF